MLIKANCLMTNPIQLNIKKALADRLAEYLFEEVTTNPNFEAFKMYFLEDIDNFYKTKSNKSSGLSISYQFLDGYDQNTDDIKKAVDVFKNVTSYLSRMQYFSHDSIRKSYRKQLETFKEFNIGKTHIDNYIKIYEQIFDVAKTKDRIIEFLVKEANAYGNWEKVILKENRYRIIRNFFPTEKNYVKFVKKEIVAKEQLSKCIRSIMMFHENNKPSERTIYSLIIEEDMASLSKKLRTVQLQREVAEIYGNLVSP